MINIISLLIRTCVPVLMRSKIITYKKIYVKKKRTGKDLDIERFI